MKQSDFIIVGGGLSGCLLFYALKEMYPDKEIKLFERDNALGGEHTWCFHAHDIDLIKNSWILDLVSKKWDGYDVYFPKFQRTFSSPYYAIRSIDLNKKIISKYKEDVYLNTNVEIISNKRVLLNDQYYSANIVIDARGWPCNHEAIGYQKFLGLNVKLDKPHGLSRVILKDARIDQIDGYRFMYLLPWKEDELLIEDTYYSNNDVLNYLEIKNRILDYANENGFKIKDINYEESGALPLYHEELNNVSKGIAFGACSGSYQPVTGYSLPYVVRRIEVLIKLDDFKAESWIEALNKIKKLEKNNNLFFYMLNKMVFHAAEDQKRYIIFERFYNLSETLIKDFYRGELGVFQKMRLLIGKPPVSIIKALKAIT